MNLLRQGFGGQGGGMRSNGFSIYLTIYINKPYESYMKTAKIFKNGQSQAVRLPKEFRFEGDSVSIQKLGNVVVLVDDKDPWEGMFSPSHPFSDDFMTERDPGADQGREDLD